jgi:hypothetical protein
MNDPTDLRVLMALTASLEQITAANGYQHDLTGSVVRGRMVLTEDDGLPAVSILEPPTPPEIAKQPEGSGSSIGRLELLIQGFVKDDKDHPTDPAYRLRADVKKRLAYERTREEGYNILGLGHLVTDLQIGQGVVRPPDPIVSDNSYFWLLVTLTFAENLQNPFA